MSKDNCRNHLKVAGHAYPKSGCEVCGGVFNVCKYPETTESKVMIEPFIFKEIKNKSSGDGGARIYIAINTKTGESEAVMEQTITKRVPVTELDGLMETYRQLNEIDGRPALKLESFQPIT